MVSRALARLVSFSKSDLARNDRGVTAIEYGLIAGLVAVAIVGSLASSGGVLNDTFSSVESALMGGNSVFDGAIPPPEPVPEAPDPGGMPGSDPHGSDLDPVGPSPGGGGGEAEDSAG